MCFGQPRNIYLCLKVDPEVHLFDKIFVQPFPTPVHTIARKCSVAQHPGNCTLISGISIMSFDGKSFEIGSNPDRESQNECLFSATSCVSKMPIMV